MSDVLGLCTTGVAMGAVHVLTGPDHLSAIATLSVNVGNCRAFWYGVRWGVGHSLGLVVVGSIFIGLENREYYRRRAAGAIEDDARAIEIPQRLEDLAAYFVGLFMLALGLSNLYAARRRRKGGDVRRGGRHRCHHPNCDHNHDEDDEEASGTGKLSCDPLTGHDHHVHRSSHALEYSNEDDNGGGTSPSPAEDAECSHPRSPRSSTKGEGEVLTKKFISLYVGIAHGVAGPGGVLGVIPAVRLHDVWHSAAYLGSFCASSILVMGTFAAGYGSLSEGWTRDDEAWAHRAEIFSASLSVLVGCLWLVLLHLGILDEVFP